MAPGLLLPELVGGHSEPGELRGPRTLAGRDPPSRLPTGPLPSSRGPAPAPTLLAVSSGSWPTPGPAGLLGCPVSPGPSPGCHLWSLTPSSPRLSLCPVSRPSREVTPEDFSATCWAMLSLSSDWARAREVTTPLWGPGGALEPGLAQGTHETGPPVTRSARAQQQGLRPRELGLQQPPAHGLWVPGGPPKAGHVRLRKSPQCPFPRPPGGPLVTRVSSVHCLCKSHRKWGDNGTQLVGGHPGLGVAPPSLVQPRVGTSGGAPARPQ